MPTKAGIDRLDTLRFRDFLQRAYNMPYPDSPGELLTLLQNMNLATGDGMLNRAGNSTIRNPILVSYIAKGLLPYRGLGSGIKRALEDWPDIDFIDDREGCLFTATVHRKGGVGSEKTSEKIIDMLKAEPGLAAREVAEHLGISRRAVEKQIARMRKDGRIRRVGPARGGRREVIG